MATLRGSGGGGKEIKRGTSPSSSVIKKSPKPSSSNPNDEKTSSTSDTSKPVPNYLKPTMSSSLDFSRIPKKSSTEASAQKPALNRRRSFERPPPASQVSKAICGPPAGTRDIKPQRSTSFSNKTVTPSESSSSSTKSSSEKSYARASSLKDRKVGPQMTKSWSIKKSTLSSPSTKREPTSSSSSSTKKPPRSVTSESSVDCESRSVDRLVIEDEFVNIDDSEVQSLPEMSEMPDSNSELADPTDVEMKELEHVEEDPKESIVEEDHQPHHEDKLTVVEQVTEEPAAVLEEAAAEQESEKSEDQNQTVEEVSVDNQPKVEPAEEQNLAEDAEDYEDDSDIKVLEVDPLEIKVEETKKEEVEEPKEPEAEKKEEEEKTEAKDEKPVEEAVSSPPADTAAAPVKKQAAAAEKKEKQDYNDVIEETASKLMGTSGSKRPNKVLALAGAFETVISLQDTKKG
ncbi:nucleolin-like [Chenopodium quinoa]|uniref:Calmodulin-binding domain-containing protein n=1 Tax=Chenopodium quinoa TaxID=63459 RepID=A0A803LB31_CHEQI|nr:nucleolin-like [Chenopodium quinoa]